MVADVYAIFEIQQLSGCLFPSVTESALIRQAFYLSYLEITLVSIYSDLLFPSPPLLLLNSQYENSEAKILRADYCKLSRLILLQPQEQEREAKIQKKIDIVFEPKLKSIIKSSPFVVVK